MVQVWVYHWSSPGMVYQDPVPFHPEVDSYLRLKPALSAPLRRRTAVIWMRVAEYERKLGSTVKLCAGISLWSRAGSPSMVTTFETPNGCTPFASPGAVNDTAAAPE